MEHRFDAETERYLQQHLHLSQLMHARKVHLLQFSLFLSPSLSALNTLNKNTGTQCSIVVVGIALAPCVTLAFSPAARSVRLGFPSLQLTQLSPTFAKTVCRTRASHRHVTLAHLKAQVEVGTSEQVQDVGRGTLMAKSGVILRNLNILYNFYTILLFDLISLCLFV